MLEPVLMQIPRSAKTLIIMTTMTYPTMQYTKRCREWCTLVQVIIQFLNKILQI